MHRKHAILTVLLIVLGISAAFLLTKFQPQILKEKIYGGTPYTTVITPSLPICSEDTWSCGAWSAECGQTGVKIRTRTCTKTNDCAVADTPSPATTYTCELPSTPPPPSCTADTWSCGSWGACSAVSSTQTRQCSKTFDCEFTDTPSPAKSQGCTPPASPPPAPKITPSIPAVESTPESSQPATEPAIQPSQQNQGKTTEQVTTALKDFQPVIQEIFKTDKPETVTFAPVCDSDHDGICDDQEKKNGTDPYLYDTDRDGIPDSADPDPLKKDTCPDANSNGVCDDQEKRIEQVSGVSLKDSGQRDTDGDGISDLIEARIGTDINNADTDFDGIGDGVEYLQLASNPKKAELKSEITTPIITNIRNGEVVSSNFTISGVAPAGKMLDVWLLYKDGRRVSLGKALTLENGRFLFNNTKQFTAGQFIVYVESSGELPPCGFDTAQANVLGGNCTPVSDLQTDLQAAAIKNTAKAKPSDVKRSQLILIEIAADDPVKAPAPRRLADAEISEEIILKNLQVTIRDNAPTLSGITELGTTVIANWTSALLSSAIIADIAGGGFEIKAPSPLLAGSHRVLVYAKQPEQGTVSPSVAISFKVSVAGEITEQTQKEVSDGETGAKKPFSALWVWLAIGGIVLVAGGAIAMTMRKKT